MISNLIFAAIAGFVIGLPTGAYIWHLSYLEGISEAHYKRMRESQRPRGPQ